MCLEHFIAHDYSRKDPEAARHVLKKTAFRGTATKDFNVQLTILTRQILPNYQKPANSIAQNLSAEGMNETPDIRVEEVEFSGSNLKEFLQGMLDELEE